MVTDEMLAQRLIDAKLVRQWTPPQAGMFAANVKKDGWWYGASGALMYIVANTEAVPEAGTHRNHGAICSTRAGRVTSAWRR